MNRHMATAAIATYSNTFWAISGRASLPILQDAYNTARAAVRLQHTQRPTCPLPGGATRGCFPKSAARPPVDIVQRLASACGCSSACSSGCDGGGACRDLGSANYCVAHSLGHRRGCCRWWGRRLRIVDLKAVALAAEAQQLCQLGPQQF